MSFIRFTIGTQAIDFSPATRGAITVAYRDINNQLYNLTLILRQAASTTGYFEEVPWIDGASDEDNQQCLNYRGAFVRDFQTIGTIVQPGLNINPRNLFVTVTNNEVRIDANVGTFDSVTYSGNVLIVVQQEISNTTQVLPPVAAITRQTTGDCDNIDYIATAAQGTANYTLEINGQTYSNWDGSALALSLPRNGRLNWTLTDADTNTDTGQVIVPRRLIIGEFVESFTQYTSYADVIIENTNPVSGTAPIEYALESQGSVTGSAYTQENIFPQVLPGTYELFIRDVYGCEITKTIVVPEYGDGTETDSLRFFDIMYPNSLVVSELPEYGPNTKRNFFNARSTDGAYGLNYKTKQKYVSSDTVTTQFKSSYPYHNITLHNCDGTTVTLNEILIQENIGAQEKVDCELFILEEDATKTGVYFDGGNEYEPNTENIIGPSSYQQYMPSWAEIGQIVFIDGLGGFTIEDIGFREDIERSYFVIGATINFDVASKVQITYNIQKYNLYEVEMPLNLISGGAGVVVFEKGYSFSEIDGNPWVSEEIQIIEDSKEMLKIEWSSTKNKGGLVFQSGYKGLTRIAGEFLPKITGETEGYDGDERYYGLKDTVLLRHTLQLDFIDAKLAYKMAIVAALDGFIVNGVKCRRSAAPEITGPLGDSNLFKFTCELALSGNAAGEQGDEIVLNPSTGNENISGVGGAEFDGKTRLSSGTGFVTVNGDFIEI